MQLVQDAIAQRDKFEPVLHAYHRVNDAAWLRAAELLDRQIIHGSLPADSSLFGIPVSIKGVFGVEGYPCFAGAPRALPTSWHAESEVVAKLRSCGITVSGTTHAAEFSVGGLGVNPHWGTPRNPWDTVEHRVPGGSSSGAANSVWLGSCGFAIGSDTGGSVRVPSSLAGLVGFRPHEKRWSTRGIVPLASRFDTVGLIGLRVSDVARIARCVDALHGHALDDISGMRLQDVDFKRASGRCWQELDPGIESSVEQALEELAHAGMRLRQDDGNLFAEAERIRDQGPNTAAVELSKLLERDCPDLIPELSQHVREFLQTATTISDEQYRNRVALFTQWRQQVKARMGANEVVVLPTVRCTPPTMNEIENRERFVHYSDSLLHNTVIPSLNGCCAVTLPIGLDATGIPVGLQLVARAEAEHMLLHAASLVERQLGNVIERLGLPPLLQSELH